MRPELSTNDMEQIVSDLAVYLVQKLSKFVFDSFLHHSNSHSPQGT